ANKVLSSSGHRLDAATERHFSNRFAHDFSRVRIHSGPDAALAADSVRAAAFTAGEHIVFGGGRYQPHREEGRRLLAHELAHVAQHTGPAFEAPREIASDDDPAEREAERLAALSAGPLPVRTAARPGALYRQAEAAACSLDPGLPSQAGEVIDKAKERLDTLSSFTAADPTSDQRIALRGLSRHFALAAADVPKHLPRIRERVGAISSTAASIRGGNMRCAAPDDGFCAIADAYVQRDSLGSPTMTFCPSFLAKGTMGQVETFIHEVSHAADPEIKDWVYASQRAYSRLTTDLALRNADSYSYFITEMRETISGETRELPTGEARHPDRFEECGAHQTVLAAALAEAELANYEALRVFSSPDLIQARAERLATFGIVSNDGSGCKVNQALAARYRALFEAADAIFGGSL
ncbi:MAG TPA: hypothetical protein DEH78_15630, partial [Solibacterales bacterium]|nr:hypothetical protein [Bryobacterales bacterium]